MSSLQLQQSVRAVQKMPLDLEIGVLLAAAPTSGLKKKRSFDETCQMLQGMV